MQRGGQEPPFCAGDRARFPVLLFSHGLRRQPDLQRLHRARSKLFASHGYVVVAPFHGDSRFADARIDNARRLASRDRCDFQRLHGDAGDPSASRCAPRSTPCSPTRASRRASTRPHRRLRRQPRRRIAAADARRAAHRIALGLSSKQHDDDTRLKAAVGYVPYFGQPLLPAFGRDQQGLEGVDSAVSRDLRRRPTRRRRSRRPRQGMLRLTGVRQLRRARRRPARLRRRRRRTTSSRGRSRSSARYVDDDPLARATSARMTKVARRRRRRAAARLASAAAAGARTSAWPSSTTTRRSITTS